MLGQLPSVLGIFGGIKGWPTGHRWPLGGKLAKTFPVASPAVLTPGTTFFSNPFLPSALRTGEQQMTGWVTMALLTVGPFAGGQWPQSSPLDRLLKDAQQTKGKVLRCSVPGIDTPSSLTDLSAEHTLPAASYCTHTKKPLTVSLSP